METNAYTPFFMTVLVIYTLLAPLLIYNEIQRKKDDARAASFQRHMRIENGLARKETRRILDEIQQTNRELKQINKENAIYHHRMFGIIDDPEKQEG